jgi:hypothetical protein
MIVREAHASDLDDMIGLLEQKRLQLQNWEPRFWRKSEASADISKAFLGTLIDDATTTVLVAEIDRSIWGCLQFKPAFVPPVYEPGGTTWMVDDFVVSDGKWATVGLALLQSLRSRTIDLRDGQLIFPVPIKDTEASQFFETNGLSPTTTWWTISR